MSVHLRYVYTDLKIKKIFMHASPSPCSLCCLSCLSPPLSDMPVGRRSTSNRHICTKALLADGRESPFTEHCRDFEKSYRVRINPHIIITADTQSFNVF